jgi:hypothetical protein
LTAPFFSRNRAQGNKQGQAQIDGGGVERIGSLIEIRAKRIIRIQAAGPPDQDLCEIGENPPVVPLVGVGQRGPRYLAPNAQMVQAVWRGSQASLDVPQALAVGQLRESHAQKLIPA